MKPLFPLLFLSFLGYSPSNTEDEQPPIFKSEIEGLIVIGRKISVWSYFS